jgi:hypothetical protein
MEFHRSGSAHLPFWFEARQQFPLTAPQSFATWNRGLYFFIGPDHNPFDLPEVAVMENKISIRLEHLGSGIGLEAMRFEVLSCEICPPESHEVSYASRGYPADLQTNLALSSD